MATVPPFTNPFANHFTVPSTPVPGPRIRAVSPRPSPTILLTPDQVAAVKAAPADRPVSVTLNTAQVDAIHLHQGNPTAAAIGPDGWPRNMSAA